MARDPESGVDRRQFLLSAGAALGGGALLDACGGEGEAAARAVASVNREDFIVHSEWCLETPRRDQQGLITPNDKVFVRNNIAVPSPELLANEDAWQLTVGGVREPKTLTLAELKRLGVTTVAAVLQCSGNGRAWFEHGASGSQWGVGAAANVRWTGVPVRAVADALGGPVDGAAFLTGGGADRLPGMDPNEFGVERSVPIDKGLADCLLAWEMNAEPIPLFHGGPLRLIVPGYYGINNIKYLDQLSFTAEESPNRYQRSSYRLRPVGESSSPDQETMWSMNVKSWITDPLGDRQLGSGLIQVVGVAFAGELPVVTIEVSVDGGDSWNPAEFLGLDLGPTSWRRFVYEFDARAGVHTLASRATDLNGVVQPEARTPNERGYGNNSWRDPSVRITVV